MYLSTRELLKVISISLVFIGLIACKSTGRISKYDPNEFTLLIATSNHGEVGPCG